MENRIIFNQLGISEEMSLRCIKKILDIVSPYSMVHESGIIFTMASVVYAIKNKQPGVLVECGTWRGGCAVAMLMVQREIFGKVLKPVYMLDSFAGLPIVDERDGPLAAAWQAGADKEKFFDNCIAATEDLQFLLNEHNFKEGEYHLLEGWFKDTIPILEKKIHKIGISVLRLDCDWYSSTEVSLNYLCPIVSENSIVIVDDYYAWDGSARAVHDYFSRSDLPYRIKSLPYNFGAYFIKRKFRDDFQQF